MDRFFARISKKNIALLCVIEGILVLISFIISMTDKNSPLKELFSESGWILIIFGVLLVLLFGLLAYNFKNNNREGCKASGAALISLRFFLFTINAALTIEVANTFSDFEISGYGFYGLYGFGLVVALLAFVCVILNCCTPEKSKIIGISSIVCFLIYALCTLIYGCFILFSESALSFGEVLDTMIKMAEPFLELFIFGSLANSEEIDYCL